MQPLNWYLNRLRAMSAAEIAGRVHEAGRNVVDRWRFSAGRFPASDQLPSSTARDQPPFRVSTVPIGAWTKTPTAQTAEWLAPLVTYADQLVDHRLTFFNLEAHHAGTPIDWNRDHEHGKPTPMGFAPTIDYRDARQAGDAKVVWEPSRH